MAPSESSQPSQRHSRPLHEWIVAATLVVTSLSAVAALFFTRQSIQETNSQLGISEQGQITDRYNSAITNLGSRSIDIRLGGIYALQRLMQDSPRDQPTVVAVLCAFVRDQTQPTATPPKPATAPQRPSAPRPTTDVQAAVTVVGTRDTAHDGRTTVVDFTNANLDGADLARVNLAGATLTGATLRQALLIGSNLSGGILSSVRLTGANLTYANLRGTILNGADLSLADLEGAKLTNAFFNGANLTRANFSGANLTDATLIGAEQLSRPVDQDH